MESHLGSGRKKEQIKEARISFEEWFEGGAILDRERLPERKSVVSRSSGEIRMNEPLPRCRLEKEPRNFKIPRFIE